MSGPWVSCARGYGIHASRSGGTSWKSRKYRKDLKHLKWLHYLKQLKHLKQLYLYRPKRLYGLKLPKPRRRLRGGAGVRPR